MKKTIRSLVIGFGMGILILAYSSYVSGNVASAQSLSMLAIACFACSLALKE